MGDAKKVVFLIVFKYNGRETANQAFFFRQKRKFVFLGGATYKKRLFTSETSY